MDDITIVCIVLGTVYFLLGLAFLYLLWLVYKKLCLVEKEILVLSMMEDNRKSSPPMTPKEDNDFYVDYNNLSSSPKSEVCDEQIVKLDELHNINESDNQNDWKIRF